MNPLFAQLALDWLQAEVAHNPAEWKDRLLDKGAMSVAVDRVYQVLAGEVKWSEASPGDKAIWKSRVEDVPLFLRTWHRNGRAVPIATNEAMDDLLALARLPGEPGDGLPPPEAFENPGSYRERTWWNYYDTWESVGVVTQTRPSKHTAKLFDNTNVGQRFLTNLQTGHQFPHDDTFVMLCVYATVSTIEALHWGASRIRVEFLIGDRQCLPDLFLRDLFRGVELVTPTKRPLIIPVRQRFGATVHLKESPPNDHPPFDLTFHFEGLRTRQIV
jgi:hypothetical protein